MSAQTIAQLQAQLAAANARIQALEAENTELRQQVEELSVNPNFNVRNRVAGLIHAENVIREERRANPSGELSLITIDIGGMGNSNSSRGEVATNVAMTQLLEEIRNTFRQGDVVLLSDGQLNSGDEFLCWLRARESDLEGITIRLDLLAKQYGFEGAYCGVVKIEGIPTREQLVELANLGMEQVYPCKKVKKAKKAKLQAQLQAELGALGILI